MKMIIDASSKRIINVLNMLSETQSWITIGQFSEKLNVSEKTIHDDLKEIRELYSDSIGIENSATKGIRATNFNSNKFLELQSDILLSSISVSFLLILLEEPNQSLNAYADKLHISRSTIYRQLPNINHFLENYQINLENNYSNYSLVGKDEYIFRRLFSQFIFEIFGAKPTNYISKELFNFYKNRIKKIYSINNETLFDLQITNYTMFYHFSVLREKQGKTLSYSENFNGIDAPFSDDELLLKKKLDIDLPLDTFKNIESHIAGHRHTLFNHKRHDIIEQTNLMVEKINKKFNIDMSERKFNGLKNTISDIFLSAHQFNILCYLFYDRFSSFSNQLFKINPVVHSSILKEIHKLEEDLEINIASYYNYIIYIIAVTSPAMMKTKFSQSILIISNYSIDHGVFLSNVLQSMLPIEPSDNNIVTIHYDDIKDYNLNDYYLIISNTDLSNIQCFLYFDK